MEKRFTKIIAGLFLTLVIAMSMLLCVSAEGTGDEVSGVYDEVPW